MREQPMNTIDDIKRLEEDIKELTEELEVWENYNKIENDLLRDDIKSKKRLLKVFKEIRQKCKV